MSASEKEQPVQAEWNVDFIYQQFEQICTKYVIIPPIQTEEWQISQKMKQSDNVDSRQSQLSDGLFGSIEKWKKYPSLSVVANKIGD